jgi:hypothetical protein
MMGTRVSYLDEQQSLEGYLVGKPPAIASRIPSVEVVAIVPQQSEKPSHFWLHNSCPIVPEEALFARQ